MSKITEIEKRRLIKEGARALFQYHNGRSDYWNKTVEQKVIEGLEKEVEVLIPLIEKVIEERQ